ncbi:MAG TPA: hypothetical protein VJT49_26285 [Amycolatopsis sp.]|uniref:hypothetical protein n=1 Tax=Amycolatopsis sp. TaxID=37632 RepID=UPI002B461437|nr:hypothetical protein [Amycolatopsis sp.]HKS48557.1 hypothetical protein [Amycolatopsis sp.]
MAGNRHGRGGCAIAPLAVFSGLPLTMLLAAPAIAAHIVHSGAPGLAPYLPEWRWAIIGSPLLALVLVRLALDRKGRLRGESIHPVKRWLGTLARAAVLFSAVNGIVFLRLTRAGSTDHVIADGMPTFIIAALAGIAVLVAIALWDRRPEPVIVEEIRAATAEADRTLRRVRAENERVRRQADQVQARLAKLRARTAAGPAEDTSQANGQAKRKRADRQSTRVDVDFHALRTFHRESYQCADTAHAAYQSAQASLRTMSYVVRRARLMPRHWPLASRAAKLARAEMRTAAAHLARSQGELRAQVGQGWTWYGP